MSVSSEGTRAPVALATLEALATFVLRAEKVKHAMLSVTLVSKAAIARVNRAHLGRTGTTDVIAFAFDASARRGPVVGDVYVCPAVAAENARRLGVGSREETERLVVHGTLHALGWDHPESDGRESSAMWVRQEQLLRAWRRRSAP